MIRKPKRELILEIFEENGFQELSESELEVINARLKEIHGRGGVASPAYIASVLLAAGKQVRYQEELTISDDTPAAIFNFAELFNFDSLSAAEKSLRRIDQFYRRYQAENDEEGMARCREVANRGRLRAQLLANNERLAPENRLIKAEILFWFELWLRTPDLFEDWLALRRSSADFRNRFGPLDQGE